MSIGYQGDNEEVISRIMITEAEDDQERAKVLQAPQYDD